MSSHLSAVGLSVVSDEEMQALFERAAERATEIATPHGCYLHWFSLEGAELWLQVDRDNNLVGVTPFFEGKSSFKVALAAEIARPDDTPFEGALYGWANPPQGETESGEYPFVFDVVDRGCHGKWTLPMTRQIRLAAFAHELKIYGSEQEYEDEPSDGPKFAVESFIPSGLFVSSEHAGQPPESMAIFTGRVLESSLLTNPLTGAKFHWALVKTLGGIVDVVADPEDVKRPIVAGGVLSGSFWLCGRILDDK
jgi:hypothetical protein